MKIKTFTLSKSIWLVSIIILGISLLSPTYCTNAHCSTAGSGLFDLLTGWIAALFMGETYFAWFANPFLIAAIFTKKSVPLLSFIFSVIALIIALTFLDGGKVLLNEAGHMGYITKLLIGYWLWIFSMFLMIVASLIGIIEKIKNKKINSVLNLFTIIHLSIFLCSCDCFQYVSGTIMDKETGKPLEGVTVYNKNKDWIKITTDSTGHFELSSISGGFRCPPIRLIIEKENYSTIDTKIPPGGNEVIQLEKNISLK